MKTNPTDELIALDKITAELNAKRKAKMTSTKVLDEERPGDDFIIDLSASCTKDQAVMRLLGWGRDTIYPRKIQISEDGVLDLKSRSVFAAEFSLLEFVSDIYRDANRAFLNSVPLDAPQEKVDEILEEHLPNLDRVNNLVQDARRYMIDIVDALAEGPTSGLRIDADRTAKTSEQYITIKSLDDWSEKKYRSSLNDVTPNLDPDDLSIGQLHKPVEKMSKTERSLYTLLGLTAEAYAKELGSTYFHAGQINVKETAVAVAGHADSYLDGTRSFPAQSVDSVRARLTVARDCLAIQKRAVLSGGS